MDREKEIAEQREFDQKPNSDYTLLFDELKKAPGFHLPANFASGVLQRIDKMERRRRLGFYLVMALGAASIVGSALAGIVYSYGWEALPMFEQVTWWGVGTGIMVVTIQWLDRRLIRKPQMLSH